MSRRREGEVARALSYAARHGGQATGLPRETLSLLGDLGYVEAYPYRSSGSTPWNKDVYTGLRLTEAGYRAAGVGRLGGCVSLAYGGPESAGWTLTMTGQGGGMRVALVPMSPSPYHPRPAFPPPRPDATVEDHADPREAAAAFRRLADFAERWTCRPPRVVDPGYVACGDAFAAWEDHAAIDAGQGPGADEILARVDDVLAPGGHLPRP